MNQPEESAAATPQDGFEALGLSEAMTAALAGRGFRSATPIQLAAIPIARGGVDVIGGAATGTGKTVAFLVPVLERIAAGVSARAVVVAPTRELAEQIADEGRSLAAAHDLRVALIVGGVGKDAQANAIDAGAELVVATPGRLLDLVDAGRAGLSTFDALVLDEADRLLDLGFGADLERVVAAMPQRRQTLLFSATIGGDVDRFAASHLREPARVMVDDRGTVPSGAAQAVYFVAPIDKPPMLLSLMQRVRGATLVFVRTRERADRLHRILRSLHLRCDRIHAGLPDSARRGALERFAAGKTRVLVATNLAARGLDIADIAHVVNYDLPDAPEDYVHRVGRTARMERSGVASTLVAPEERIRLAQIERLTRDVIECRLPPDDLPRHRDRILRARGHAAGGASRDSAKKGARRHSSGKTKRRLKSKTKAKRRRKGYGV